MGGRHQAGGNPDPMKTLKILSGGAAHGLVEKIRPAFEAATGCTVDGTFSAVGAMRDKLLAGEPADVMILTRTLIDQLAAGGHVMRASMTDVATVATAIAVRNGDPLPPMRDAGDLTKVLFEADAIHIPDPENATAGWLFVHLMKTLGFWSDIKGKLRLAPNGATAMRALATSTARRPIGWTQETEIRATPGVVLVRLPPEHEPVTIYTAAITTTTRLPEEAAALIARLGN
jgi:molybdate transport system substrate-binding protein